MSFKIKIRIIISYIRRFFLNRNSDLKADIELFDGDDILFKSILLNNTKVYAEYGCGASTEWVAKNTTTKIYSVDTSSEWVKKIQKINIANDIEYIDCGPVGDWGTPMNYTKRDNFISYTDWIWQQKYSPDTVLIDGRFRVCCFLTCLKYAKEGTQIIFDDYFARPNYHIVEEFLKKSDSNRRQCVFEVPNKLELNLDKINYEIERFRYVVD
jgi:hypothetical protein